MKPKAKRQIPQLSRKQFAPVSEKAGLIVVLVVLALIVLIRLRLAGVPLERDEGEYAYSGQLILQGIPPYSLAYNMKFPGTYYAYSIILLLFGQTAWGIHVGLIIVNAATILILFFLARQWLESAVGATVTAIAFGIFTLDRWILGIFGHATHFVALSAVAGLLVLWRAIESKRASRFIAAGILFGLSVLMKQNGILFFVFGMVLTAWAGTRNSSTKVRDALWFSGLVAGGAAIPFGIVCLILFTQGTLTKFWFWTFRYAQEYVSRVSISDAWGVFANAVRQITQADLLLWILAAAGIVLLWVVQWPSQTRIILTGLAITSLLAVCPGFYFRAHYFILLLPAAALLCGVAVVSIERLLYGLVSTRMAAAVAVGVFVVSVATYVVHESNYLFLTPLSELSRIIYGSNPFVEAPEIARYLQSHTSAAEKIAVMGSEPEIYFYAKRKSATGYIYMYPLMEQQKYSQGMQDEMIEEVTAGHPKYIIYNSEQTSWLVRNTKERILTWSEGYLSKCYTLVGVAEIASDGNTRWFWDANVAEYRPRSPDVVYTFRANSESPCVAVE